MIKERFKSSFLGRPSSTYYRKTETGMEYRRIHGGIQWPGANPGAVIVLGEDLVEDVSLGEHPIRLFAEYESRNPSDIIARCGHLKALMQVEDFYGNRGNRAAVALMENCKVDFSLLEAPFIDDITANETYLSIIREKSATNKKVLFFGKHSALPAKLATLPSIPTNSSLGSDFPLITALGYALASLILCPYEEPLPIMPGYGPSDPGVGF